MQLILIVLYYVVYEYDFNDNIVDQCRKDSFYRAATCLRGNRVASHIIQLRPQ